MKLKKLVCGALVVSMMASSFAGCSKNGDDKESERASQKGNNYNISSVTAFADAVKEKYSKDEKYEYAEQLTNLEKDHVFVFENVSEELFKSENYNWVEVYYDKDLKERCDTKFEIDYENNKITLEPNLMFNIEDKQGNCVGDGTWGSRTKFFMVQRRDEKTGKEFAKPIITIFTVKKEFGTPTLTQYVDENGNYCLKWTAVEGIDYYEVFEYSPETDYAYFELKTDKTSCTYDEFQTAIHQKESLQEILSADKTLDQNAKWSINSMLDKGTGYLVVGRTNDGKVSGLSNTEMLDEIGDQIPVTTSDDFVYDYEGESALMLPAYGTLETVSGGKVNYLIEYHGSMAYLLEDGSILLEAKYKNLDINLKRFKIKGMEYDAFREDMKKVLEREDELVRQNVTIETDIDIPYVPETDDDSTEPETTEPETDDDTSNNTTGDGVSISDEIVNSIYGNSALTEWIAFNMLQHNETISLEKFNEAFDTEYLQDCALEAYRQNPLIGILDGIKYGTDGKSIVVSYVMSKEETEKMQTESLKKAKEIAEEIIKDGMSDLEKEEAINDYLCENTSYDEEILKAIKEDGTVDHNITYERYNSFTPYGILVEKCGVCESYSEAFLLIAKQCGLDAILVTGRMDNVNHEWNKVKLDNQWYTLDVTNNDNQYTPNIYYNLPDDLASTIYVTDTTYLMDEFIDKYTSSGMDKEYYNLKNKYTENPDEAAQILAKDLKNNNSAIVRMDQSYGGGDVTEIIQLAINASGVARAKYLYKDGIIAMMAE